ncbi:MAG TPA: LLM class flavin-dependent oxidoreductase [Burkholderiales bacterium]|jgi:alkanesulfonate monooxygenase SsuD/methylene tetrahydromethanopterin reductase-like flavin-dependent oxidoreductase (luciferase family)
MRYSIFSVNDHHPRLPRTVPQLYEQVMRQCELSETLGYDTFFCAEHHFHEYGVVPDPAVMLSALAQRTRRVRLGTAISILTFHDPRRIAESYSMLDMMSGGRLVFGAGSGYLAHEFAGYDVDPKEKRDRFNENLDLVRRLMAGETLSYRGRFSKSEKAMLNVLPHGGRVPPIYVAVLAREAAFHVGRQGNRVFTVPYASCRDFDDIGAMLAEYRRGRAEAGLPVDDDDHVFTLHTYVAKSDAEAKAQCKAAYDLYVDTRLYAKKHVYEDIIANGICLFGSVETVAGKMRRLHEMGVRHVATMHNFGALAPELVERSMGLFAREVMPAVASAAEGSAS